MWTIEKLQGHADAYGIKVTRRQIEEWHRAGLLPPASRPPVKGKKGRGPLVFPEPAQDVVLTLGRWRRYMTSDETAKVWLWLEGYDYTGVDIEKYWATLRTTFVKAWPMLQQAIPGLPSGNPRNASEQELDKILESLDTAIMQPMLRNHESIDAAKAAMYVGASILGLDVGELWEYAHEDENGKRVSDSDNFTDSKLVRSLFEANHVTVPDMPSLQHLANPLKLSDMLQVASLFTIPATPNWDVIRLEYHTLCVMSDNACPFPEAAQRIAPGVTFLRSMRQNAYGKGEIGLALSLLALAAISSLTPPGEAKRSARKMLDFYKKAV